MQLFKEITKYVSSSFIPVKKKGQIIEREYLPNALFEVSATVLSHSRCYKYYNRCAKNGANDSMEAIPVKTCPSCL